MGGTPPVSQARYSYSDTHHLTGDRTVLVKTKPPRFFEANSAKTQAFSVKVGTSVSLSTGGFLQETLYMRPDVARAYNDFMLAERVPMASSAVPETAQVITGAQFDSKLDPAEALAKRIGPTRGPRGNPIFREKPPGVETKKVPTKP